MFIQSKGLLRAALFFTLVAVVGCKTQPDSTRDQSDTKPVRVEPAPAMEPRNEPKITMAPMPSGDGWTRGRLAYPTGDAATSALMLEKSVPAEVTAGKAYEYEIKVTNISRLKLEGVEVSETVPANLKLAEMPGAMVKDGMARYAVGNLMPGESKSMKVTATAGAVGTVNTCASVSYNTTLCLATNVVSPALKLTKSAPAEAMVCDTIPMKLVVTNSGTGSARNIKIEDALPAGMTTADGRNSVSIDAGTLAAGQSKEFTVSTKVAKTGKYDNKAIARADNGLTAESNATSTMVRQPVLAITKTGTAKQFIGRPVTYEITVTNKGDAVAANTVITDALPAESKFVSATDGGTAAGGKVTWNVGDLAPNATKKVSVTLNAAAAGMLRNQASAQAKCADAVAATAQTEVTGIPALLLDGVDEPDPIQLGGTVTYTLNVTNQGSANLTNVKLVCTMDDGDTMIYVSDTGPTKSQVNGKVITFAAIPTLAPKQSATYKIVIKAAKAGQVQFRAESSSNEITRPLVKVETTNFYE